MQGRAAYSVHIYILLAGRCLWSELALFRPPGERAQPSCECETRNKYHGRLAGWIAGEIRGQERELMSKSRHLHDKCEVGERLSESATVSKSGPGALEGSGAD